ncbi:DgyrCDS14221 [Dimorphilus gyrociliatus]|uniref:phosphorylase kinase n=1 Tax=Dimorphilus gyrociliatus TaxID=2664684 RepID=A0A7I8WD02_9ANNE|nr:DgyrCDS14221 [Dimorphilus gyrociliatus]
MPEQSLNLDEDLPAQDIAKEFYAKYEPKEVLGRGISSTVRRCAEKETGHHYAVKIIDLTGDKDSENDHREELRIATKKEINVLRMCAQHQNIIELHNTFESPTFIFLVFELCQKGELFDFLTQVVTLSEKRTRIIMKQLLDAIAYIHSRNIVHRDVKPENILLDDKMNVKLSDFGFATVINSQHELTELCGTPGYLAPEVLKVSMYEDEPGYGTAVDLWACGVIMYTLLVGCPPFWHRKQMLMLRAIMEGKYNTSTAEWLDLSDTSKDLIEKLLQVEPEKRITAKEALCHPFFYKEGIEREMKEFFPKRKFRALVFVATAIWRLRNLHKNPPPISMKCLKEEPYCVKGIRKLIDAAAFKIYSHWVKKGEKQNRAALFQSNVKCDIQTDH